MEWTFWEDRGPATSYAEVANMTEAVTGFARMFAGEGLIFVYGQGLADTQVIVPCVAGWRLCSPAWGYYPSGEAYETEGEALDHARGCAGYSYHMRKTIR